MPVRSVGISKSTRHVNILDPDGRTAQSASPSFACAATAFRRLPSGGYIYQMYAYLRSQEGRDRRWDASAGLFLHLRLPRNLRSMLRSKATRLRSRRLISVDSLLPFGMSCGVSFVLTFGFNVMPPSRLPPPFADAVRQQCLWDPFQPETGERVVRLTGRAASVAFSPDNARLAVAHGNRVAIYS